ncbi:FAD-dependent oxidoreductase, partial [Streptococcus pyogenes]
GHVDCSFPAIAAIVQEGPAWGREALIGSHRAMSTALDFETVVIGGGVIGLAIAEACARKGQETVVLERHSRVGQEISSRSSEVVHA